jgi:ribosome-associated protein
LNDFDPEQDIPSKTARKKEMLALQKMGETLLEFSNAELEKMALDPALHEALMTARRIKSREGLRRQMQYVGKLMRKVDVEPIENAIAEKERGRKELARRFHELEELRDQLVEQGVAGMEAAVTRFPELDRQHLRNLLMQVAKEQKANKPPAASRKLFKYLRELQEQADAQDRF